MCCKQDILSFLLLSYLTISSVDDRSVRYVAEENIAIVQQEVGPELMALAGQHFKRFDEASRTFVSNIKDEYPDD